MPSKRKKNKRRMRRVQAQRRMLEEQHAACPPVKASPSIAVGAPGTVSKKAAKTPKPAPPKITEMAPKIPEAVPIAVPIVEAPKVEPPKEEPVVHPVELVVASIEVEAVPEPEPEIEVLEEEIPEVVAPAVTEEPTVAEEPVVTQEPIVTEEPTVTEEEVIEAAPVEEEAPVAAAVVDDVEEPVLEAETEIEVTLPAEALVAAPAEIEVVPEETAVITEVEQEISISNEDLPMEQDALPPLTAVPEPVTQIDEIPVDTADVMVDDFVVTDSSAEVIEPKTIELLPVFEKPTVAVCEIFGQGPAKTTSEPEIITAVEDTIDDGVEEPEPCQIPLEQESVTNTSINMLIGTEWMAQQQVPGLDC